MYVCTFLHNIACCGTIIIELYSLKKIMKSDMVFHVPVNYAEIKKL